MKRHSADTLRLGVRVIELLIPHRRPFLMVDGVESFRMEPIPRIQASRHVSGNEAYFEGHFPGLPIWPGALTMEGLGQSAVLLLVLTRLCRDAAEAQEDPRRVLDGLRNLDLGYRLHPGYQPNDEWLLQRLASRPNEISVGTAVDMKFSKPVLPGCRLDYTVELTDVIGSQVRFAAEAFVDEVSVARGTIGGAVLARPAPPRASP